MKYRALKVLCALVFSVTVSCVSGGRKHETDFSMVASVDGGDKREQALIGAALTRHRIDYYMEGSVLYAVMVPNKRLKEARMILRLEKSLSGSTWIADP